MGGGIRGYTDSEGKEYSALDVASRYFRAGADKVSIGSDAVYAAVEYWKQKKKEGEEGGEAVAGEDGKNKEVSSISQISKAYGAQAVVVSGESFF